MGGSSKKQTVGYKYSLGMHLVTCHGPVDRCLRIRVDKRTAWEGSVASGPIAINAPKLFGGEKKEGGIVGTVDFETGAPTQDVNDYLAARLGALATAFRGVCAFVLRQVYLGLNPYLKPWEFRLQRIHVRQDGVEQWYDEKSAIEVIAPETTDVFGLGATWSYQSLAEHGSPGTTNLTPPSDGWDSGPGPFGKANTAALPSAAATEWTPRTIFWLKKTVSVPPGDTLSITVQAENGCVVLIDGVAIGSINPSNVDVGGWPTSTFDYGPISSGSVVVAIKGFDEYDNPAEISNTYLGVVASTTSAGHYDMNPAHIIRECLTDPDWGMGYGDADVDDASFTAAADTLYDEGFGLSTLWSRQTTLEEFIGEILRHIDAVLYVDNGLFVLKLARADYDPGTLLELDEDTVLRVEDLRRPALGELVNSVTVRSWDNATSEDAAVTVHEDALVQLQGREINHAVDYPAITHAANRQRVALRDLKTLSTPLASCTVVANRAAAGLRPGGVFKLTWPAGGLSAAIMRVVKIGFGDAAGSTIKIECAEDIFSFPESQVRGAPGTGWSDPSGPPAASPARLVIEAPYLEIVQYQGQTQADADLAAVPEAGYLLVAAQRPSDEALNAEIQVDAGAGYDEAGTLDFCPVALLASAIGPTDTVVVLTDIDSIADLAVGSLAQLGAELVRIDAISATTATLGRGVLDTVPVAHAAGERLWGIDLYAASDFTQYVDGEVLSVKVLPATGQGELDIADAPADSVTMGSRAIRPYPPADVRLNGASFPASALAPVAVTWVTRNRVQQTSGTLLDWFDATVTPEAGQSATIRLLDGATEMESWPGETDGTVTLATDVSGTYTLEASSQRDGFDSFQTFLHEFVLIGSDALFTESGEALETEAGAILTE